MISDGRKFNIWIRFREGTLQGSPSRSTWKNVPPAKFKTRRATNSLLLLTVATVSSLAQLALQLVVRTGSTENQHHVGVRVGASTPTSLHQYCYSGSVDKLHF